MADYIMIPKRKTLNTQQQADGSTTIINEPGITNVTNNVTNSYNLGGDYLPLSGGTMRGKLDAAVLFKVPVGTDMYA